MVILDSNIFIYLGTGRIELDIIKGLQIGYASVTAIETLGYRNITVLEERRLNRILQAYPRLDLTDNIIKRAITLRQDKKISLGDSIIAATAIEENAVLWTVNSRDFEHIAELTVFNPLSQT